MERGPCLNLANALMEAMRVADRQPDSQIRDDAYKALTEALMQYGDAVAVAIRRAQG